MFTLQNRRLRRHMVAAYKFLKKIFSKTWACFFLKQNKRGAGNWWLKEKKMRLNITRNQIWRATKQWNSLSKSIINVSLQMNISRRWFNGYRLWTEGSTRKIVRILQLIDSIILVYNLQELKLWPVYYSSKYLLRSHFFMLFAYNF